MPFRDVIGHRRLVGLLSRSVHRESLPPSLIFAGPAGVGKRLAAIATAQALNCLAPHISVRLEPDPTNDLIADDHHIDIDACGTCAACTRIARGVHPDVLVVEPGDTGSIKIEQVREVAQQVLAQAAASDDPRRRIEGAKDLLVKTGAGGAGDREQLASHLRAMESLLRDVELLSTRADARALANPDVQPALERLARTYQGERGMRAFTAIDRALAALDRNAGVKAVADWVVLQL